MKASCCLWGNFGPHGWKGKKKCPVGVGISENSLFKVTWKCRTLTALWSNFFGELITLGACSLQPVITRHDWDAWCPLNRGEQRGSGHSCGFHTRGIQHRLSAKELDKYTLVWTRLALEIYVTDLLSWSTPISTQHCHNLDFVPELETSALLWNYPHFPFRQKN